MKKNLLPLITVFVFFLFSCSKDEGPNQVGSWEGIQYQTITTDGTQTGETSLPIELTLTESGSGNLTGLILGSASTIHWVVDETANKIYIIKDLTLSNGDEVTSTDKFDIIVNTADEQKWEQRNTYTNPAGEEIEVFTRWSLLK